MCGHARGLRRRTDGRAGTSNPATERRDGLFYFIYLVSAPGIATPPAGSCFTDVT